MEKDAMEAVVQDFNRSQSRIWVEYQAVSVYQQKTLIAIGGRGSAGHRGPARRGYRRFRRKKRADPARRLDAGLRAPARGFSADLLGHGGASRPRLGGRLGADRGQSTLEQGPVPKGRPRSRAPATRRSPSSMPSAKSSTHRRERQDHPARFLSCGYQLVALQLGFLVRRAALGRERYHHHRFAGERPGVLLVSKLREALRRRTAAELLERVQLRFGAELRS